ncbi:MAG: UbiA family prenyltransferase [Planctomycetes bacterium]|nr:UbiA family prenyltransferase [Planctomycetota bacterium]
MKLTPILKLVRLSALPSAWADQFGGMALAFAMLGAGYWRFDPIKIVWLLLMSFGVYLGGMALNDVLHVRKDRLLRKARPIASGELKLSTGWLVTLALFAAGIAGGFVAGCGGPVLALIALIFLYNHLAAGKVVGVDVKQPKAWAIASVFVIAACRGLHVSLPLIAHAGTQKFPQLLQHTTVALFAGSVFVYFCFVTIVSLFEDTGGGRRALLILSLLLVPVVLTLPIYLLAKPGHAASPILGVFVPLGILAWLLQRLWRKLDAARKEPIPPKLGACVGAGIRGEALLMAGFALMLAPAHPWWGLSALAMYPAGIVLSKWISPT